MPSGFSVNPQTGAITGTAQAPEATGHVLSRIRSRPGDGHFTLTVVQTRQTTITTSSNLPDGTVGIPYFTTIDATGPGPISFSLSSGQLPDGLHLLNNGQVSGTPTRAGAFTFLVVASDAVGNSPNKSFNLIILPGTLAAGGPSTTLFVGTAATIPLTATGGAPPYTFALSCTLPDGLSFSGITISGTPTTPGSADCTVTVTDSLKATASKGFTIKVIAPPITFTGGTLPAGQVGADYTGQVTARGGTPPFTYSGTGLPDGLSLAANGAISGTPTTAGQFSFSITATDTARATRPPLSAFRSRRRRSPSGPPRCPMASSASLIRLR